MLKFDVKVVYVMGKALLGELLLLYIGLILYKIQKWEKIWCAYFPLCAIFIMVLCIDEGNNSIVIVLYWGSFVLMKHCEDKSFTNISRAQLFKNNNLVS